MRKFIRDQFERFFIGTILNFERGLDNDVVIAKDKVQEIKAYLDTAKKMNHPDAEVYKKMLKQAQVMVNGKISLKNNFAEIKDKILLVVRGVFTSWLDSEKG